MIISNLLNIDCKVNRISYVQEEDDIAVVFKLNERAPESVILTIDEIEKIGYQWGILKSIKKI